MNAQPLDKDRGQNTLQHRVHLEELQNACDPAAGRPQQRSNQWLRDKLAEVLREEDDLVNQD